MIHDNSGYRALVARMDLRGGTKRLADACTFGGMTARRLTLDLSPERGWMRTEAHQEALGRALGVEVGEPLRLEIRIALSAREAVL